MSSLVESILKDKLVKYHLDNLYDASFTGCVRVSFCHIVLLKQLFDEDISYYNNIEIKNKIISFIKYLMIDEYKDFYFMKYNIDEDTDIYWDEFIESWSNSDDVNYEKDSLCYLDDVEEIMLKELFNSFNC